MANLLSELLHLFLYDDGSNKNYRVSWTGSLRTFKEQHLHALLLRVCKHFKKQCTFNAMQPVGGHSIRWSSRWNSRLMFFISYIPNKINHLIFFVFCFCSSNVVVCLPWCNSHKIRANWFDDNHQSQFRAKTSGECDEWWWTLALILYWFGASHNGLYVRQSGKMMKQ